MKIGTFEKTIDRNVTDTLGRDRHGEPDWFSPTAESIMEWKNDDGATVSFCLLHAAPEFDHDGERAGIHKEYWIFVDMPDADQFDLEDLNEQNICGTVYGAQQECYGIMRKITRGELFA